MTKPLFRFSLIYLLLAAILFLVEVLIALYVHDAIVRPYVGDFLVVILIYCFFKSFLNVAAGRMSVAVLVFAYMVEILQYFNIVSLLGLQHSKLARIVIGTSFEWIDLVSYTLGILVVMGAELWLSALRRPKSVIAYADQG